MKQAGHYRIQLVRVLGHMGIDANEIADRLARQSYVFAHTGRASPSYICGRCQRSDQGLGKQET